MKVSMIGLSLSSSWGNSHATTYRSLLKGLQGNGHNVHFFEREEPWYAAHRDLPDCESLHFYCTADDLLHSWYPSIVSSDLVIIGSYVRETPTLVSRLKHDVQGVLAFYDIDTPVTIAHLRRDRCEYLTRDIVPEFDLYLSFSGGSVLEELRSLGALRPLPLYCSVDPEVHRLQDVPTSVDLGYLGTYSADRRAPLSELLLQPAVRWGDGRFAIAGPQYPETTEWPANVRHLAHLPPSEHAQFYSSQRFTLNLTRSDMRQMGHSPSVRLFEAACCGTPIISDEWTGLDAFFSEGEEILIAKSAEDVLRYVREFSEPDRTAIGAAARRRVLAEHTGDRRAREIEAYVEACA